MNEANILKILRHPNIPIIYDIEEDENYIYIIEEYIEGQSLRAYKLDQTSIEEDILLDFLIQLSEVLDFLHTLEQPILYLDLKPDNILLTQNKQLKLVDFGTAQVFQKETIASYSYGTKGYAAPEQYGRNQIDKRADIYGLGGILYFLVSGHSYMETKEELEHFDYSPLYSKSLIKLMKKSLEYHPKNRYQSAKEVYKEAVSLQEEKKEIISPKTTPHIITLAGMISRIGTTHVSLIITAYLNSRGIPALYIEENDARVIESLKSNTNKSIQNKIPMARGEIEIIRERYSKYKVFVCDCGLFSKENSAFFTGNTRFLLLGSKPWEWKLPQIELMATYLFNFTSVEDFFVLANELKPIPCVRVPFVSDYLLSPKNRFVKEFLQEILKDVLAKKKQKVF